MKIYMHFVSAILLTGFTHASVFHPLSDFENSMHKAVSETVEKYHRHITYLEIGAEFPLCCKRPFKGTVVQVLMMTDGISHDLMKMVSHSGHKLTLLAPNPLTHDMLTTLTRCEHFDVVVVHDLSPLELGAYPKLVNTLKNLGDHVFIEAKSPQTRMDLLRSSLESVASKQEAELFVSHKPKKGLDIARYTQKGRTVAEKPRYQIESTFSKKTFFKKNLTHPLKWIEGINLITFAMFKGRYPDDEMIRSQIVDMQSTHKNHNDFVLGNIIVQGDRLIVIDMDDKRRDADFTICLTAALQAFSVDNIRLSNPEKWIYSYYDAI
jgi:hypothetical protein